MKPMSSVWFLYMIEFPFVARLCRGTQRARGPLPSRTENCFGRGPKLALGKESKPVKVRSKSWNGERRARELPLASARRRWERKETLGQDPSIHSAETWIDQRSIINALARSNSRKRRVEVDW